MLKAGQTILLPKPGQDTYHLWVILLAQEPAMNETVMVNLTTQREHSDKTTILQTGDHPFVVHTTAVHYADARIVDARKIAAALENGAFPTHCDCSGALLDKIRSGLFASPFTPGKVKTYVAQRLML